MLGTLFHGLYKSYSQFKKFGYGGLILWSKKHAKKKQTISVKLKDFAYPIYLRTASSDYETFLQVFDQNEYKFPYPEAAKVIIDCGANIGFASLYLARLFPDALIIAVEPEPSNFELLKKNTALYPNITCINSGIWTKKTMLEIVDTGIGEWGFMVKECAEDTPGAVPAVGINDIMQDYKLQTIDILKIDIEGSEKEVFSENEQLWLPKVKMLVTELHDRMKKGTANAFFNAINKYEYRMEMNGENIFIQFL
ncbi:hypothetical protein CAP35_04990 [Chitinophagaceae bacterium IBVUCB1]|nr:hypothetical protein CAP35_04990 [Chitinophagaceae bacterium IBVUCB1]